MASCGGCHGGCHGQVHGPETEWGPNCCPPLKQNHLCKRKSKHCPVHGRLNNKFRIIPAFPGHPMHRGKNVCPIHGPKPYHHPKDKGMYDQPGMGMNRMGMPQMGQPGVPANFTEQNPIDELKSQTPFERIRHQPVDIRGIPICNNMAFFDHPLACGIEMKRSCGGGCNLFYVNPKNFKISGNSSYNNNKGLEGDGVDMFFVTEESETEDESRFHIRDFGMIDKKMHKEAVKIDKTCDTSSLFDRIDQGGDSIYIETKQRLTNNQFASDERNVQFGTQKSTVLKQLNTIEDHDLLKSWVQSLRSLEDPGFPKLPNDVGQIHNKESHQEKFQIKSSKKERNSTKRIGICCPYNSSKNQKMGIPNELTELFDERNAQSANPAALKSKLIKNNSNTLFDLNSKSIQQKSNGPTYKNWFNNKLDDLSKNDLSKKCTKVTPKQKKPKKGCENFIRRNILRVKSYQKQCGVKSQSRLGNFSVPTISKIKIKKSPVKSCPDTLPSNVADVMENVSKWCCTLPNEVHSLGCSSHQSEPSKCSYSEPSKSVQTTERVQIDSHIVKTEKALIVNSKTGSVKSISFEIDDSERNKVFTKQDGDLRLPIISLKTKTGTSAESRTSCESKSADFNDDQEIQKDIFQIKGFLYETIGDNRETLYISYSNLKKLVRSYSKRLHLKKRENSNDDLTLLLRDSVEA